MYLYKKTIKPKNTVGKISALLLLLSGGAAFAMANAGIIALPALAQTIGVITFTASIYIASAYLLREYTISVELRKDDSCGGEPKYEFRIDERRSKLTYTVCRMWLSEISSANAVDRKAQRKTSKEMKKAKKYLYDTTFAPIQRIAISACVDEEELLIFTTFDEDLLRVLKQYQ